MWKVLLSEGESPGARGPELYEPLRTGTCVLAQVLVGRGALACLPAIREGPPGDCLRRGGSQESYSILVCHRVGALVLQVGTQVPRAEGRHFGFASPAPGLWRRGISVGGGCWERERLLGHTPPPHRLAHVVRPAQPCPCLSRGLSPGAGATGKASRPVPRACRA